MTSNFFRYIVRETGFSMRRNPWLSIASVLTVMVSLVILGFSVFFLVNTSNAAHSFESQLQISVYMQENVTSDQVQGLQNQIQGMSGVATVTLVTKQQALDEFGKSMSSQSNVLSDLQGTNPFPDKFEVEVKNPQNVATVADAIKALPGIENVNYGQDYVNKLLSFTRWLRWIGFGVVAAFAVASIVLISINVKMTVFAKRREIQIMSLVGASNSFIRWPFLLEGLILGLLGGALAALIVGFGYDWLTSYIQSTLSFLPVVRSAILFQQVTGGLLLVGIAMGVIGSGVSLQKFLRS